jgi:hypothetical protein
VLCTPAVVVAVAARTVALHSVAPVAALLGTVISLVAPERQVPRTPVVVAAVATHQPERAVQVSLSFATRSLLLRSLLPHDNNDENLFKGARVRRTPAMAR